MKARTGYLQDSLHPSLLTFTPQLWLNLQPLNSNPKKVQDPSPLPAPAMYFTHLMWLLISLQVTKSNTNPDDLGGLANQLTNEFGNLANEAKYAAITAENDEVQ